MQSTLLVALLTVFMPTAAHAHITGAMVGDLAAGFVHPFRGLDHMLAMIAVGLRVRAGERSGFRWAVVHLAILITLMLSGAVVGMAGVTLSLVETWITVSVLVLGLLVAASLCLSLGSGMLMIGLFALCPRPYT